MESVFTIDVEDWFHILDLPSTLPLGRWDDPLSHVEADLVKLLDILAEPPTRSSGGSLSPSWPRAGR
ncbi:MAG TPA: hypothetical protein VG406_29725 [Isosphaeraceae bacterium]|jgi:hypothetical protein|nr:hypothetical protein [Isosphaeraceae bacterium]